MRRAIPRLLIAGTHSGCGKTTVACAILQALKNRGWRRRRVQVRSGLHRSDVSHGDHRRAQRQHRPLLRRTGDGAGTVRAARAVYERDRGRDGLLRRPAHGFGGGVQLGCRLRARGAGGAGRRRLRHGAVRRGGGEGIPGAARAQRHRGRDLQPRAGGGLCAAQARGGGGVRRFGSTGICPTAVLRWRAGTSGW